MKFVNHHYRYYDEYHDIVQNNNLNIHLLKTLFFHEEKKKHDRELYRYEIDDYERIYRCNMKYSPTEIEKRWESQQPKEERIMFEQYDEFINKQFYCHMFGTHLRIFGFGDYRDIKADEYNYSVIRQIERRLINSIELEREVMI